MQMLAVMVIVWSHGGSMTSQQIEMPTLELCRTELVNMARLLGKAQSKPEHTWMFCVGRT